MENIQRSAVFLWLDRKLWLLVGVPTCLRPALSQTLSRLHELWSDIALKFPDGFRPEVFKIKLILDFVVALFLDNVYNSFHVLAGQLSYIDTEFFFLSQWYGIIRRIGFFRFSAFLYLGQWSSLANCLWGLGCLLVCAYSFIFDVRLCNDLEIVLLKLLCDPCEIQVALVKTVTVPNDLVDICMELSWCSIHASFQVVLNLR